MHQIITIGSALVDIFIHSAQFTPTKSKQGDLLCQLYGDKTEVDGFNVFTGGGGSNTAVGFARLGFKTAVMCETGRDGFARLVMQDLQDQQVSTQLVIEEKKEQTGGSVILIGPDGERTVLVHRGAASMLDPFDISAYWLSEARHVHVSSLGGQRPTLEKIFKLVAHNPDLSLSWNPGKKELALLANRQLVPVQPQEPKLAAQKDLGKSQEVTPDTNTETEQDPINYKVIIEDIQNRTRRRYRPEQIKIVVETIAGLQDNPARGLVMDVLEEIAKQLRAHLVNFPDHSLIELTEKKWKKMSGAEQAGSEPEAQAEDEPMRAGDTADGPVEKWTGSIEASIDPSGGPSRNLGEPMDKITS